MQWRIYYGDGSCFSSEQGTPWDAPRVNVQMIIQEHPRVGWEIVSNADQYYFEEESRGWYSAEGFTLWDHLVRAKMPLVVFGRMISTGHFDALVKRVMGDLEREGKPKTGWLRNG